MIKQITMLELELYRRAGAGSSWHSGFLGLFGLICRIWEGKFLRKSVRFHFNQSGKGNIEALTPAFSSGPASCLIYFSSAGWCILGLWLLISPGLSCPGFPRPGHSGMIWPVDPTLTSMQPSPGGLIGISIIRKGLALQINLAFIWTWFFWSPTRSHAFL